VGAVRELVQKEGEGDLVKIPRKGQVERGEKAERKSSRSTCPANRRKKRINKSEGGNMGFKVQWGSDRNNQIKVESL